MHKPGSGGTVWKRTSLFILGAGSWWFSAAEVVMMRERSENGSDGRSCEPARQPDGAAVQEGEWPRQVRVGGQLRHLTRPRAVVAALFPVARRAADGWGIPGSMSKRRGKGFQLHDMIDSARVR